MKTMKKKKLIESTRNQIGDTAKTYLVSPPIDGNRTVIEKTWYGGGYLNTEIFTPSEAKRCSEGKIARALRTVSLSSMGYVDWCLTLWPDEVTAVFGIATTHETLGFKAVHLHLKKLRKAQNLHLTAHYRFIVNFHRIGSWERGGNFATQKKPLDENQKSTYIFYQLFFGGSTIGHQKQKSSLNFRE